MEIIFLLILFFAALVGTVVTFIADEIIGVKWWKRFPLYEAFAVKTMYIAWGGVIFILVDRLYP